MGDGGGGRGLGLGMGAGGLQQVQQRGDCESLGPSFSRHLGLKTFQGLPVLRPWIIAAMQVLPARLMAYAILMHCWLARSTPGGRRRRGAGQGGHRDGPLDQGRKGGDGIEGHACRAVPAVACLHSQVQSPALAVGRVGCLEAPAPAGHSLRHPSGRPRIERCDRGTAGATCGQPGVAAAAVGRLAVESLQWQQW